MKLDCYVVTRIGTRRVDPSANSVKLPGYIIDLNPTPLGEESLEQIRALCGPCFALEPVHHPFPTMRTDLEPEQVDQVILGLAREKRIQWDKQPYVLAWFQRSAVPNNVVRFIARFHGVTGYFPSLVQFRLKPEFEGTTDPATLADVRSWKVHDIQNLSEDRTAGAALRSKVQGVEETPLPEQPRPVGTLPSAIALVAFQWPRWVHSHADEDLQGEHAGRRHLDRLGGRLQPGNVLARNAVEPDLATAFQLFAEMAECSRRWDLPPVLAAVREYLRTAGNRYQEHLSNLADWPARFAAEFRHLPTLADRPAGFATESPQLPTLEIQEGGWPSRRVAVDLTELTHRVIRPLLNNAAHAGATRLCISARASEGGQDGLWTLAVSNDGDPMGEALDAIHTRTGAGIEQMLTFADRHLATVRVHSREGAGTRRRTRSNGSYRWTDCRTSLVLRPSSAETRLGEWSEARTLPSLTGLRAPWRVRWEIQFDLDALGEPQ